MSQPYSSEYSLYYHEIACNSTTWAHPDASDCGCHGSGWWLSELDTWHKCPLHPGDRHPEEPSEEELEGELEEWESSELVPQSEYEAPYGEDDDLPF